MNHIYLDNNATTPVLPEVVEAMLPFYSEQFGNPSSLHRMGAEAGRAVTNARNRLANVFGVGEREVVFTSGATESINTAIRGIAKRKKRMGKHIVTTLVEHDCVLASCQALEEAGWTVTYLPTDQYGAVSIEQVSDAVREDTTLVAIMHVNNELGTINPVNDIGKAVKAKNPETAVVSDGVQAFGKMPISLEYIDVYAVSAHKIHGPKGVGALVLKDGVRMKPLIVGGNQEFGWRSGTQNVPGIVGFGKAVELAYANLESHRDHVSVLRNMLRNSIESIGDVVFNSPDPSNASGQVNALETTLNVSFLGVSAETLLHALEEEGIFVSTGSACSTNNKIKSHVLEHITDREEVKDSSIRFGLSRLNTEEEIEKTVEVVRKKVEELRNS